MAKNHRILSLILAAALFMELTISPSVWMVYATDEEDASEEAPELLLCEEKVTEKGATIHTTSFQSLRE